MKRWTLLSSLTLLCLATTLAAEPPGRQTNQGAGGGVTLYADAGFRGVSQSFDRDVSSLQQSAFGNDRASSLVVAPGCQVELFSDANFRGRSMVLEGEVPSLDRTPVGNDSVSSMRVSCGYGGYGNNTGNGYGSGNGYGQGSASARYGVTLYAGANFTGRSETFTRDDSRLNNNTLGDNQVRSVAVSPGCRATLFDLYDYGGRAVAVDRDTSDLAGTQLGNFAASSLRVKCSSQNQGSYGNSGGYGSPGGYGNAPQRRGVTLFSDDRFSGASETFFNDVSRMDRSNLGNDRASSVRVDRGCRAWLYSDSDFRGRVTVVEFDEGNLQGSEVGNDSVSSMRVDCRGR